MPDRSPTSPSKREGWRAVVEARLRAANRGMPLAEVQRRLRASAKVGISLREAKRRLSKGRRDD